MKTFKKLLSLTLCIIMLMSVIIIRGGNYSEAIGECSCDKTPVIYIKGRTNIYKTTDDPSEGNMAEINLGGEMNGDKIGEAALNITAALLEGLATDNWDNYCDVLYEEITPIYDQYALNNDGEIDNKSGIDPKWNVDNRIAVLKANGRQAHIRNAHEIWHTQFQYDMRLDPCKNAEDLRKYIEAVKEVTGHDKVAIAARCEGTVIANAYFQMFGYDDIETYINFNGISCGAEIADDVYTNKVEMDPHALNSFINTFLDSGVLMDFIKETVNLITYNGVLGGAIDMVGTIYDKVSTNVMPRLIRGIFGTCPGWWGMVSPEAFEEAKAFVLSDNEDGKYDKLIEKLDNYNNNYKVNVKKTLLEMQESGVNVYVLTKYGSIMYPVIESYNKLGDGVVSVYKQSINGAVTGTYTDTLSDDYIGERVEAGFGKYISADKKIDGSTAALPDHTWYFKELAHDRYPDVTDSFMLQLIRYKGYADVNTFAEWPQYTLFTYEGEDQWGNEIFTVTPLTEENKDDIKDTTLDTSEESTESMLVVLMRWFTTLFNFLRELINGNISL